MSSPIGHSIAGLIAWEINRRASLKTTGRYLSFGNIFIFIAAANLPDIDLLFNAFGFNAHRFATHSVFFVPVTWFAAGFFKKRGWEPFCGTAPYLLAGAHASHLLLDFFSEDYGPPFGIAFLWPFSGEFMIAGIPFLPGIHREPGLVFSAQNASSVVFETVFFGLLWAMAFIIIRGIMGADKKNI